MEGRERGKEGGTGERWMFSSSGSKTRSNGGGRERTRARARTRGVEGVQINRLKVVIESIA